MDESARRERNRDKLSECDHIFASKAELVIKDLEEAGFRPRIQQAWRSPEEQLQAFVSGHSKLRYGFHNVTGLQEEKEALAVDLLDDDAPVNPSTIYLLQLATAAAAHDLETGILWGLPAKLSDATEHAIEDKVFDAPVKIGWDPTHLQVTGLTPAEAKRGERPT